jgi:hypothetical protein
LPSSIAAAVDVHRTFHHRPPSPPSNANARYRNPLLPLLNAIFADVTLPPQSNAIKLCHHNQAPVLTATVVHYHRQMLPLIAPPSMRHRRRPTVFHRCLEPLLIVEFFFIDFCTFILAFIPPHLHQYTPHMSLGANSNP